LSAHQPSGRWQLGLSLALLTAVFWGVLPVAITAILPAMDVLTITWYRLLVAAVLVGGYQYYKGGLGWRQLRRANLALYMLAAVTGLVINYLLWAIGLDYSSTEATQVVIQVAPLLLMVISVWLYKEPFGSWQVLGLMVFIAGLLLFFYRSIVNVFEGGGSSRYHQGILIVFVSALSWVVYGLAQKRLLKDFRSPQILATIYIGGAFFLLPLAKPEQLLNLDQTQLYCLVFASFSTIVSYGAFAMAMEHWQASRVSATVAITPLTSVLAVHIAAWALPGIVTPEQLSWLSWLGAFLVVAGTMTIALVKTKAKPKPTDETNP